MPPKKAEKNNVFTTMLGNLKKEAERKVRKITGKTSGFFFEYTDFPVGTHTKRSKRFWLVAPRKLLQNVS